MPGCHVQPEQMFNLIFGYNDRYCESNVDLSASAGTVNKNLTVVPAGEAWVIQAIAAKNQTRIATVTLGATSGGVNYAFSTQIMAAATAWAAWSGQAVLIEGDAVWAQFLGTTLNDDLYWLAWGYKMVLSQ